MAEANTAEMEAQVNAAFLGEAPPVPPATPPAADEDKPEVVAEPTEAAAATPPATVPEKPQYVRLTKQEWDNTKAAAGKVASLESQVAKLTAATPNVDAVAAKVLEAVRAQTPAGADIEITDEDFAEMMQDFPELAGQTRTAFQRVLKKMKGTGVAVSPAQTVDIEAVTRKVRQEIEVDALVEAHPDWDVIVGRPPKERPADWKPDPDNAFRKWLATQPADYQDKVNNTSSPAVVKAAIDKFKSQPAAPAGGSNNRAAARRELIKDAVTPRGDGGAPPIAQPKSADDAFNEGFKAFKRH